MSSFFLLVALYAFVAGGVAIKRRGLPSLRIASRKAGFGVVGAGFVMFIIAGAVAPPTPDEVTTIQPRKSAISSQHRIETPSSPLPSPVLSVSPSPIPPSPSPAATVAASPPKTTTVSPPAPKAVVTKAAPAPAPPPPPPPPAAPASNCHASYEGECIPADVSDADCAGGSGDGPYYVQTTVKVVGPDDFGLDRDKDGWGCEP